MDPRGVFFFLSCFCWWPILIFIFCVKPSIPLIRKNNITTPENFFLQTNLNSFVLIAVIPRVKVQRSLRIKSHTNRNLEKQFPLSKTLTGQKQEKWDIGQENNKREEKKKKTKFRIQNQNKLELFKGKEGKEPDWRKVVTYLTPEKKRENSRFTSTTSLFLQFNFVFFNRVHSNFYVHLHKVSTRRLVCYWGGFRRYFDVVSTLFPTTGNQEGNRLGDPNRCHFFSCFKRFFLFSSSSVLFVVVLTLLMRNRGCRES